MSLSNSISLTANGAKNSIRLCADWREFIEQLPKLGKIESHTQNQHAIHVRKGEFSHVDFESYGGKIGAVDGSLELRYFLFRWASCYATTLTDTDGNSQSSLQFIDKYGEEIQLIYLLPESNKQAYNNLIEKYQDKDQNTLPVLESKPSKGLVQADSEIDVSGLRQAWSELKHTHDFYPMLKLFKVQRQQAFRLAGQEWAVPISVDNLFPVLKKASQIELPIMVFVGNNNALQIYSGTVHTVKNISGWLTVSAEDFIVQLSKNSLSTANAWVIRKPTTDGIVTSLEVFSKGEEDNLIVTFFSKRRPGQPQNLIWRDLLEVE